MIPAKGRTSMIPEMTRAASMRWLCEASTHMHAHIAWSCAEGEAAAYLCADPDTPRAENTALGVSDHEEIVTAIAIASGSANCIATGSALPPLQCWNR